MLKRLPEHIAIIMDGNGRWASERNLPRTQGHVEGVKRVEEIVAAGREMGIKILTLFTFSTENWTRPANEVSMLMRTLTSVLNHKVKEMNKSGIKINFIGRREGIPEHLLESIEAAERLTENNEAMTVNVAFNYGGRQEICDAVKQIAQNVKEGNLSADQITEDLISRSLYTQGMPDPDLLIRTSGEKRISNFFLWQLSYSELYFTEKYWPEFTRQELEIALEDYAHRERRYGNVSTGAK